ncbi:hypothetical protein NPIL_82461 [Nephila pilipes]|uniref:Uncharacterized protein n=1 Tax=Nephila pilipes TaxID=299642 RepID=A0A8X6R0Y4_NEPPI|nr:hypothetical protein NPIL_82461 [Nephila pilipes]
MNLLLPNHSTSRNKKELILRITEDNIKRNEDGTLDESKSIRMQHQNDNENINETLPDETELFNEIETLRKQVELLSNCSYISLPPPFPPSQIDPSITTILAKLMESQKLVLYKHLNTSNVIQITSTNETANSIQMFKGEVIDNALN